MAPNTFLGSNFYLFCICVCCVSRCTNPGRKYDIKMKTLGVLNAATFFKVLVTGSRTKLGVNLLDPTETTYCITGIKQGLFFNCLYDDKGKALGERDACRSIGIKPSEELLWQTCTWQQAGEPLLGRSELSIIPKNPLSYWAESRFWFVSNSSS